MEIKQNNYYDHCDHIDNERDNYHHKVKNDSMNQFNQMKLENEELSESKRVLQVKLILSI